MRRVFIETTIPSYYYETRSDRRSVDWRAQTRLWWDSFRSRYDLVSSPLVVAEFERAPKSKSSRTRSFFSSIRLLEPGPRIGEITRYYIEHKAMPVDATGDAAHLAIASIHACDFLLTWNCRHLANANKQEQLRVLNNRLGLKTPIISTPFELIPE